MAKLVAKKQFNHQLKAQEGFHQKSLVTRSVADMRRPLPRLGNGSWLESSLIE